MNILVFDQDSNRCEVLRSAVMSLRSGVCVGSVSMHDHFFNSNQLRIYTVQTADQAQHQAIHFPPDFIFFNPTTMANIPSWFSELPPSIPKVAIISDPNPEYLGVAIKLQAIDLLMTPLQITAIRSSFKKGVSQLCGSHSVAFLACFYSSGTAIGKTVLSANIAAKIYQHSGKKVLLADLQPDKNGFSKYMNKNDQFVPHRTYQFSQHESGLYILHLSKQPTVDCMLRMVRDALLQFDVILMELPPALTNVTKKILSRSDEIFCVSGSSKKAIEGTKVAFKEFQRNNINTLPIQLLVNTASDTENLMRSEIEKILERRVNFFIPFDANQNQHFIKNTTPFVLDDPQTFVSQKIEMISSYLLKKIKG